MDLPIGTKVKMVNCLEAEKYEGRVWITASEQWKIPSGGKRLVLLEGFRGGFSVECLQKV